MSAPRQLHLNAFLMSVGHHEAAWRLPESDPFANFDLEHYRRTSRRSPSAASSTRCSWPTGRRCGRTLGTGRPARWSRPCC